MSSPLNILVLLNRVPYPLNDGGAIGAYNFIKGYAAAGCKVTMLAMNTSKHLVEEEKVKEVLGKYGEVKTVFVDNRIKAFDAFTNLFTSGSYIIQRFVSDKYTKALIELLSTNNYDVVHIDGLPPATYIPVVRKHSKAKISMRAHNVEHVIWQRIAEQESNPVKKKYVELQAKRLKEFEREAIKQCDVIMAISAEDESTIKKLLPSAKTLVVPAGMEISDVVENDNYNATDMFFIGSFDWMPNLQGVEWFIENIWPSLIDRLPNVHLTIAGKKMPPSISDLKLPGILTVGEVPNAKRFMLNHGIMLVPIVSGSGIRIKILEGMALGKTIIATEMAAEGLGLTDGENILIANNLEAFVQHISKCMNDVAFCRSIGNNAHRFAFDNYRNQIIFGQLVSYYNNIK